MKRPQIESRFISNVWEQIAPNDPCQRLMVPGGWALRCVALNQVVSPIEQGIIGQQQLLQTVVTGVSVCFIPDPDHQWELQQYPPDA